MVAHSPPFLTIQDENSTNLHYNKKGDVFDMPEHKLGGMFYDMFKVLAKDLN